MKVTIEGSEYEINLNKARELGLVTPAKRPIVFSDLKRGDIVRFKLTWNPQFSESYYMILNTSLKWVGQMIEIAGVQSKLSWFSCDDTEFAVYRNNTWITEI